MPAFRGAGTTAPNIEKILLQKMDPLNSALIHNFTRNIKIMETEIGSYLVYALIYFLRFFFSELN